MVNGAAGNDSLYGEAGNDTLNGGDGTDSIDGGDGDDVLVYSAGADTYYGGASGYDTLDLSAVTGAISMANIGHATAQNFTVATVAAGNQRSIDKVLAGSGNDTLSTATGIAVYVDGGAGNDSITGSTANDTLMGGAGNDTLNGASGNDSINGGDGDDRIQFQTTETVDGGSGVDTLWFATAATVDLTTATTFAASNVEILDLSVAANIALTMSNVNVAAMAATSNAAIGDASYAAKQVLVVDGTNTGGDTLNLTGGQWADTGVDTTVNGTGSFSIYKFGTTDLYVATDLNATLS